MKIFTFSVGKLVVKRYVEIKFNFSKTIFHRLVCVKIKNDDFMNASKSKHVESEVSGFVNDSWSCLAVWFYKNKFSSEIRSHNQVQGNKSRREKLKISKIFLDNFKMLFFSNENIFGST